MLISVGFLHPDTSTLLDQLPVELDKRGNVARNDKFATSQDGVFVAGDAGRGQSLVVWAISEGRSCAAAVDEYLTGVTELPAPITASQRPMMLSLQGTSGPQSHIGRSPFLAKVPSRCVPVGSRRRNGPLMCW